MKITFQKLLSVAVVVGALWSCLPLLRAAEVKAATSKDSQSLLVEMRMKRWNKELEFTTEQETKIKALLDEEGKAMAKLDTDPSLAAQDRASKLDEIHKTTYIKIKPLLTEKQAPVFEKLITKNSKPRKAAAPARP